MTNTILAKRWLARAAAVFMAFALFPATATTPPSGTISVASPQLTFTTGPHFASNNGDCSLAPCDDFALTVVLPADYAVTNPAAMIHVDLVYTQTGDIDMKLLDANGAELDSSAEAPDAPEHMETAATSGTKTYTVRSVPFLVAGTTATVTVKLFNPGVVVPPPVTTPTGLAPRFQVHVAPPALGNDAAEPSIGFNPFTQRAMFISYTQALRMTFQENATPPLPVACDAVWEDKSGLLTTLNSLDPILFTDMATGRTFNSQLAGANSLFEFTDDDGENWTPGQQGAPNGGADHQTVATGVYPAGLTPPTASWPPTGPKRAVYYCSQSVVNAYCSRSDDGGQTFGPGFQFKNTECSAGALHGHVKVAPDGTVYVPDASQCLLPLGETAEKVVAFVSTDAGLTFEARPILSSTGGASSDPSVGIATDNTAYMCYENGDGRVHAAVSKDRGLTWQNDQDIGAADNIVYTRFPQSIAGDPGRAACAFLGTKTSAGDPNSLEFDGVWYPYVATTYDGGVSWHLVNTSPNDAVQGHGGVGPDGTNRNLLDFNDLQIDNRGQTYFALADGCVGGCVTDPSANSFAAKATTIRQTGGRTLFAALDNAAGTRFNSTTPLRPAPACAVQSESLRTTAKTRVVWNAPDTGGSPITNYQVYRSLTENGTYTLVGNSGVKTEFVDATADTTVTEYWYKIVAQNALGDAPESNKIVLVITIAPVVDTCTIPGEIIATDTIGDQTGGGTDMDIQFLAVAEPEAFADSFVITYKVVDFAADAPAATTFYPMLFPAQGNKYISLDSTQGAPKFTHGTYVDVQSGVLAFTELGLLDARSNYLPDGTMTMVVPRSFFGNPAVGSSVVGFDARARIGGQSVSSRDTAGPADYVVRGVQICKAIVLPLASLQASTNAGNAPLTVTFTISGTPPVGQTLSTYSLNFGDGTPGLTNEPLGGQTSVTRSHTYQSVGTWRARLTVTDSAGNTSDNLAEQTIEVGTSADGGIFSDGFEAQGAPAAVAPSPQ